MFVQNPMNLSLPTSVYGGGLILPYMDRLPAIGENVFIAPTACIIGQVTLGERASVWFGSVLRGDIAEVKIGNGTNIQDLSVLHVGTNEPCLVGNNVVVGHRVILHGCTVEDECLIGMGALILNRAVIGKGSVIGAGALVTEGTIIPQGSLVLGMPGKVIRTLNEEERKKYAAFAPKYIGVAENYREVLNHENR